jgi:hypothetical protein
MNHLCQSSQHLNVIFMTFLASPKSNITTVHSKVSSLHCLKVTWDSWYAFKLDRTLTFRIPNKLFVHNNTLVGIVKAYDFQSKIQVPEPFSKFRVPRNQLWNPFYKFRIQKNRFWNPFYKFRVPSRNDSWNLTKSRVLKGSGTGSSPCRTRTLFKI